MAHASVLLKEAIDGLELQAGDVYLDATTGSGGHMEEVWRRFKNQIILAGIDADEMSVEITREKLDLSEAKPKLAVLNFRNIDQVPEILGIKIQPKFYLISVGVAISLKKGVEVLVSKKTSHLLCRSKARPAKKTLPPTM